MKKNFFKLILPAIAAALLSSCIGLKIDRPKDNTNYHVLPPAQTSEKAEGLKEVCVTSLKCAFQATWRAAKSSMQAKIHR